MYKVFGIKENKEYNDREGAYVILVHGNQVGIVQTPKGFFFLGGGLESNESHIECIERECKEEAGCLVLIKDKICSAETYCWHEKIGYFHPIQTYYIAELVEQLSVPVEKDHTLLWFEYNEIREKMFLEMQNWALEECYRYIDTK